MKDLEQLAKELCGSEVEGVTCPPDGLTMIGLKRMRNIQGLCEKVINEEIPGDFIETGVWKGGACMYMTAILESWGDLNRNVWVADSFDGLPPPDERYPADKGSVMHTWRELAIPKEQVMKNFKDFGLLSSQVKFIKGWFKDTLPGPVEKLAILRLDGDMYSSTIEVLEALYPKLSVGGYVIIDDYSIENCSKAVTDFREKYTISEPIKKIDWTGVYWQKTS